MAAYLGQFSKLYEKQQAQYVESQLYKKLLESESKLLSK
jgi:hypothetical protein